MSDRLAEVYDSINKLEARRKELARELVDIDGELSDLYDEVIAINRFNGNE